MINKIREMSDNQKVKYLLTLKVTDLKALVKELGIKGYSRMKKAELQELIVNNLFPIPCIETSNTTVETKQEIATVEEYKEADETTKEEIERQLCRKIALSNREQLKLFAKKLGLKSNKNMRKDEYIDFIYDSYGID